MPQKKTKTREETHAARDKALRTITEVVVKHLPMEVLHDTIEEGVLEALATITIDSYFLRDCLKEQINARAKELLLTKYKAQLEVLAEKAVDKVLESRGLVR